MAWRGCPALPHHLQVPFKRHGQSGRLRSAGLSYEFITGALAASVLIKKMLTWASAEALSSRREKAWNDSLATEVGSVSQKGQGRGKGCSLGH